MSGLENIEQLVESFNEVLQVLHEELIHILFEDRDLKGKKDKFLYLQYTDVDEFTLYYDDEFGDGLNVELFKLDTEDILMNRAVILSLIGFTAHLDGEIEEEVLEAISSLLTYKYWIRWIIMTTEVLEALEELLDQENKELIKMRICSECKEKMIAVIVLMLV